MRQKRDPCGSASTAGGDAAEERLRLDGFAAGKPEAERGNLL